MLGPGAPGRQAGVRPCPAGSPVPPRLLSPSPRAEWDPAAKPPGGSLLTRQLQELWRKSRSSLAPQRLLFEVTSASVVSERSSKYVVSAPRPGPCRGVGAGPPAAGPGVPGQVGADFSLSLPVLL